MKLIAQGAEAKLFKNEEVILKDRFVKTYRHPQIDASLRKFRTKREAKVLQKLKDLNIPAPELVELKESQIFMSNIPGEKLRDVLNLETKEEYAKEIGKKVALLHQNDIIHGDLTTSNMIFNEEIYLIDFGLSFFSIKTEDKAVDLHLLHQALQSKHHEIADDCFDIILTTYQENYEEAKPVLTRLQAVQNRGRNKKK